MNGDGDALARLRLNAAGEPQGGASGSVDDGDMVGRASRRSV